ncbi:MAG: adenylyl-sulfate kinase [Nitrospirae bacterium]|jgi:adenylylsulfate kinase|nr:adenylyl-sulfate kinase [Nitrospirota bacterium]
MMERNIKPYKGKIDKKERWQLNNHKSVLIWFTGLPGSGKSTISHELEYLLFKNKIRTYVLDGDNIRRGLCKDLGFSAEDRRENLRRVGEVAKLFVDAGILTIASFASPYISDRKMIREMFGNEEFIEVYLKCDISICEKRDPKGLYKKARNGIIKNFTGVSDPYEAPEKPEILLETDKLTVEQSVKSVFDFLQEKQILTLNSENVI